MRDPDLVRALGEVKKSGGAMVAHAPVVIVVCGREDISPLWVEDCSAATQNLLLAVTALKLGAVWVGIHGELETRVRELLRTPEGWRVLCLLPIGHPAESHSARTQYDPDKVYYEAFEQDESEATSI